MPGDTIGELVVPRPVVVLIVLVMTVLLAADVGAQFVIPGHTASPVIDGAILAILGGVVAASKGPKPENDPPSPPTPTVPAPPSEPTRDGRHHRPPDSP